MVSLPLGLVMGAFEQAWNLLKALPEQQMFYNPTLARTYGDAHGDDIDEGEQERMGTVHPAIQGMLRRRGQTSMEIGRPRITHRFSAFDRNMIDDVPTSGEGPAGFRDTAVGAPPQSSQRGLEQLYSDPDVEATDENLRLYAENPNPYSRRNPGAPMFPPTDFAPEGFRSPARYSKYSVPYTAHGMEEYMRG